MLHLITAENTKASYPPNQLNNSAQHPQSVSLTNTLYFPGQQGSRSYL